MWGGGGRGGGGREFFSGGSRDSADLGTSLIHPRMARKELEEGADTSGRLQALPRAMVSESSLVT